MNMIYDKLELKIHISSWEINQTKINRIVGNIFSNIVQC